MAVKVEIELVKICVQDYEISHVPKSGDGTLVEYTMPGEPMTVAFAAETRCQQFHETAVFQFMGTMEQIKESTDQLNELYPTEEKATLGKDATWLGQTGGINFYSLVVMVKGTL